MSIRSFYRVGVKSHHVCRSSANPFIASVDDCVRCSKGTGLADGESSRYAEATVIRRHCRKFENQWQGRFERKLQRKLQWGRNGCLPSLRKLRYRGGPVRLSCSGTSAMALVESGKRDG